MNARKGLDIILAAARGAPEIGFVLVGSEGEGPVELEARSLANVRIVPWQRFRELAPWLYAADVLVIPPSLEPLERHGNTVLPIKLFLYLAAGRVLLAPRAPDTAELLSDGQNAALVDAGDVAGTVATLRALSADPGRAEALAAGALATAQSLTWEARAGRIEAFLRHRMMNPAVKFSPDPWTSGGWLTETARWLFGAR
jgi:glycosyltransferase involved in cell wall biosynthesis